MRPLPGALLVFAMASGAALSLTGCASPAAADNAAEDMFPIGEKNLFPVEVFELLPKSLSDEFAPAYFKKDLRVAVGAPPAEPIQQPIAFPHSTHVQKLGMDCNYCHSGARKGIHAGIPPTQVCMGCHKVIDNTGRPELDKLKAFYADGKGEPIPWVKVHDLPDFVSFNHKRHVNSGVQCQECHGQVQEMGVDQRVASLQMGWCLDCHAAHESIDKNYGVNAELRRAELKDCYTCHK
jgi:hypothetical protein